MHSSRGPGGRGWQPRPGIAAAFLNPPGPWHPRPGLQGIEQRFNFILFLSVPNSCAFIQTHSDKQFSPDLLSQPLGE